MKAKTKGFIQSELGSLIIPIGSVKPDPRNARLHSQPNLDALKHSLEAYGQRKPIVVNAETGVIEAGSGLWQAARELGWTEIAAVKVQDSPESAQGYALMDNQSALLAEWGLPVLKDILQELDAGAFDIGLTGFDEKAFEVVMAQFFETANYRDLSDTSRVVGDSAEDNYGYDGGSVWSRIGDNNTKAAPYYLTLPLNPDHQGDKTAGKESIMQRYSRSPFLEMENVVRSYMRPGDKFLEVCAGWWTFSTMAAAWGYEGAGIDIWDISLAFGKKQLGALPGGAGKRVKQYQGDARDLPFQEGEFDFIYSNTPWYNWGNLERYGKSPDDLTTMPWEAWKVATLQMLQEMLRVVKSGGLVVTVIADYRKGGLLVPLHTDWLALGREAGFELWDFVIQPLQTQGFILWRRAWDKKRTIKAHEYVVVFKKPDGESSVLPLLPEPEPPEELSG